MRTVGRILRYIVPIGLAVVLWRGAPLGGVAIPPWRDGSLPWIGLMAAALMVWPRLWVLAPNVLLIRIAIGFGAVDWSSWAQNISTLLSALPLICIGLTSLWRRLPGPLPHIPGTIVPNADGVGSLLSLPVILVLAATGRVGTLVLLSTAFALIRAGGYARKHELLTRGRGWVAFLVAMAAMWAYAFVWAAQDPANAYFYGVRAVLPAGIAAWAIQRAVVPYRNPTTTP